jgi:hypothetical protein
MMGIAPHRDHVSHLKMIEKKIVAGHVRDAPCSLTGRQARYVATVERYAAAVGRAHAGKRAQERRLSDTVCAEHGDELAAANLE